MKVLLLLFLALTGTAYGKALAGSNLLLADDGTAHFNFDQSNFDLSFSRNPDDRVESDDQVPEAEPDVNGELDEDVSVVSHEADEDERSTERQEQDDHLLASDEWQRPASNDYDWNVEHRMDSEELGSYGEHSRFDYPRYDYNPSWWMGQQGPIVVQPIVIPVQFAFGQQDYFQRRFI